MIPEIHIDKVWPRGPDGCRWRVTFLNTDGEWWAWTQLGAKRLAKRYLPTQFTYGDESAGPMCMSAKPVQPLHMAFRCTLTALHDGDHEAHGHDPSNRLIEWWRQ